MRKALLVAGLAALMAMPVMAEDVATLAEKNDRQGEALCRPHGRDEGSGGLVRQRRREGI